MIVMTTDVPSNHPDGKLPVLDMKVWLDDENKIFFQFYEKIMKNRKVISRSSAMPMKMKMTVLTQEVFRRLHNTKEDVPEETKVDILNRFMENLQLSGYNEKERYTILQGGFKTFNNLKEKEAKGDRPFYRPSSFRNVDRKRGKNDKKTNWYKKKDKHFKSVIFVESTPNSELVNMLKKTEEKHRIGEHIRVKFVEKCGTKKIDIFKVPDPFRKNCPPVKDCLSCKGQTKYSYCRKSNVGYKLSCKLCETRGFEKTYEGETCRNMYLRGKEHLNQYKNNDKHSVMLKHIKTDHEKEAKKVEFEMKLVKTFKDPLSRIINEGIRIKNKERSSLLNSKSEHYGPSVKRKVIENLKECERCDKRFNSEQGLQKHIKTHHDIQIFKCDQCETSFKTLTHLNSHMDNDHRLVDAVEKLNLHGCPNCSVVFNTLSQLSIHLESNHVSVDNMSVNFVENSTKCETTSSPLKLNSHQSDYKCTRCSNVFKTRSKLNVHMETHRHNANSSVKLVTKNGEEDGIQCSLPLKAYNV